MSALLASISGYKTYIATIAWGVFEILNAKHALGLDAETAQCVRALLLSAAGISFRAGVQKAENAASTPTLAPSKN